jgi:hypothetical protein
MKAITILPIDPKTGLLTIQIDTKTPRTPSTSGKNQIIASTQGNQKILGPQGEDYSLGVNFYTK